MSLRNTAAAVCLLAGCAGSTIKSAAPGREVAMELQTASKSGPGWQSIPPSSSVASGTEFSVRVTVSQPAFLYIGQRTAGSELALIYPPAQVQVVPEQPAQVPADGQWLRLDDHAGEETLFVLLSEKPQELALAKQLLSERGDAACQKTRDPPPPNVKHRDRRGSVTGQLGEDGLAVLCFPFHHI